MRALLLSAVAAVLLAPAAAYAQTELEACTYGVCDATACGTDGRRYPNYTPCLGAPFVACSAPACPMCTYGTCSAQVCGTTGTQVATNQPCTGATSLTCTAPACPGCVYTACDAVCGGGHQDARNQPCTGPDPQSCNLQTCGNGDFDEDGFVDEDDRDLLIAAMGSSSANADGRYLAAADLDGDQKITLVDYQFWIGAYRAFVAEPAGSGSSLAATGEASAADGPAAVPVMGRRELGLLLLASLGCAAYWGARRRSRA